MTWVIFLGLLAVWGAGVLSHVGGRFIHILLVLAVIDLAIGLVRDDLRVARRA